MPVEGQAQRVRTPLSRRDRRVLSIAAAAAALAAGGGIYAYVADTSSKPDASCVSVTLPLSVGGATVERCGPAAARFCRSELARDPHVAAACRRRGYKLPS